MSEFMEHSYIPVVVAMVCMTSVYLMALYLNLDGALIIPFTSMLMLLAGVVVPSPLTKK